MTRILFATVSILAASSMARADSVAVNFMAEFFGGGPFPLGANETAGVFPQQNWNNADIIDRSADVGGTADILSPQVGTFVDHAGNPTSITMTWFADKEAGSDGDEVTPDERLMKGFLEGYSGFLDREFDVRVEVENIPYPRYKVVPYLIGFGFDATASVSIDNEKYYYEQSSNFTTDGYTQATAISLAGAPLATYAVFEDRTGDSFTLDLVTEDGNRAALAGLQIIATPIPEPASGAIAVALVSAFALVRRAATWKTRAA